MCCWPHTFRISHTSSSVGPALPHRGPRLPFWWHGAFFPQEETSCCWSNWLRSSRQVVEGLVFTLCQVPRSRCFCSVSGYQRTESLHCKRKAKGQSPRATVRGLPESLAFESCSGQTCQTQETRRKQPSAMPLPVAPLFS